MTLTLSIAKKWSRRRSCLFDIVSKGSASDAEFMLNLRGVWFLFGDGRCAALGWAKFSKIDMLSHSDWI